jgi:hypothetical protein
MRNLFDGVGSYYSLGVPFLYFVAPALELFRPALDVAFSLTLILTGFACGYVAIGMVDDRIERGLAILIAVAIAFFSTFAGLLAGLLLTAALLGRDAWKRDSAML